MVDASIERISGRDLIRRGPFARLWWSQLISSLGDWVTIFATFSLAARISGGGRAAPIGILIALVARILPGLIIGVIGGVVADRFDRKRTMLIADFGRAVLVVILAFVGNYRDLFVLTFLIEVLSLIRQPARESVVPQLVPGRHLMAANGLNLIASYGTAPVGSALFALFAVFGERFMPDSVANPGVAAAFVFDGITFIVSGIVVLTIAIPATVLSRERAARGKLDVRAPLRDMMEGLRFVTGFPSVRRLVTGMAAGLFGGGALFVLGQPFSEQVLKGSNSGYGIVVTALGVGAGIGMGAVTFFGKRIERRDPVFAFALMLAGLAIVFAGITTTVWGATGWVFVAGMATGVAYVTGFTQLHAVVTDEIRGRTFAALYAFARLALLISFGLATTGAAALDGVLPGLLSSGVRLLILLSGVVIVASGAGTLWSVRDQLKGDPMDEQTYQSLHDASRAAGWIRGHRSSK
jgi:dTMP kinase